VPCRQTPEVFKTSEVSLDLSRRRDRVLLTAELDLETLRILVSDYEAANTPCAATELRRRLEWYQRDTKAESPEAGREVAAPR
jgi:hypothetical protein